MRQEIPTDTSDIRDAVTKLQSQTDGCDNPELIERVRAMELELKRMAVKKVIPKEPYRQVRKRGGKTYKLWALKIHGVYVCGVTKDRLYEKVYDRLFGEEQKPVTAEQLFPKALLHKKENTGVTDKTLLEYRYLWNRHYRDHPIVTKDIRTLSSADWHNFFLEEVKKYQMTRKQLNGMKTVANLVYSYLAITRKLPGRSLVNPIRELDCRDFPFRYEDSSKIRARAFTDGQTALIREWCEQKLAEGRLRPLYPLAILFNLYMGLRFAEMAGLRWDDISFDDSTLTVRRQKVTEVEMQEDLSFRSTGRTVVGHTKQKVSPHAIFVPSDALQLLRRIQALHLSDEEVFPVGQFRYHTYNDRVKDAAVYAGIPAGEAHTHCLRATAATVMYRKACGNTRIVQYQLRHTTPTMTARYVDDWWALEAAKAALENG